MRTFQKNRYFDSLSKIVDFNLDFSNTSILITGANGLIGGSLLDYFMYLNQTFNSNIKLYVLVRSDLIQHDFFDYRDITVFKQSVTDEITFSDSLDYIFHSASNAHPEAYDNYPVETALTNIQGTLNLLEISKKTGAHLVFISSSEVYGETDNERNSERDYGYIDILSPRSCYSESKRMAETLINSYVKEYHVSAASVRPAYIYGARFNDSNTRADIDFIKRCLLKKDIIMKSKGLQKRSYCYVLDCISAILLIAQKGEKKGDAYNISSDSGDVRLVDFAAELAKIAKVRLEFDLIGVKGGSPVSNSLLDNKKVKELGWREQFDLQEGISDIFSILGTY